MKKFAPTYHARERWVGRIVNPERFPHYNHCKKNCIDCHRELAVIQNIVSRSCPDIDLAMCIALRRCVSENQIVTDHNFLKSIRNKYEDDKNLKFYTNGKAVFVVLERIDDVPLILSIMTEDMIDGTIIKNTQKEDLKTVFNRWKQEAKRK